MNGADALHYSDEAIARVRSLGTIGINEFFSEIPAATLSRWVLLLPAIAGFRNKGKAAADAQRRRLIGRLMSGESKSPERDWKMFANLWQEWVAVQLHRTATASVIETFRHTQSDSDGTLPGFDEALRKDVEAGAISRERLQKALNFGPFSDVSGYDAILDDAPPDEEIIRRRFVDGLPEKLSQLESQVQAAAHESAARIEAKIGASVEGLAQQVNELAQLISAISSQTSSLAQRNDALEGEVDKLGHSARSSETQIAILEEMAQGSGETQTAEDIATQVRECVSQLASLSSRLDGAMLSADSHGRSNGLDATGGYPATSGEDAVSIVAVVDKALQEEAPIVEASPLIEHLQQHFGVIGLANEHAESAAREIACAAVLSQQISIRGSMASVLTGRLTEAIAAPWSIIYVPVGLFSDRNLRRWLDAQVAPNLSLRLDGVNRSAYEIYATALRELLLSPRPDRFPGLLCCASIIEGPGTLPIIPEYAELGPIVDSDCLRWRTQAREGTAAVRRVDLAKIKNKTSLDIIKASEFETDLEKTFELLGMTPSAVAIRTMGRAGSLLMTMTPSATEDAARESLMASWILPYIRAKSVKSKTSREAIAGSAFAATLGSQRIVKLLSM